MYTWIEKYKQYEIDSENESGSTYGKLRKSINFNVDGPVFSELHLSQ